MARTRAQTAEIQEVPGADGVQEVTDNGGVTVISDVEEAPDADDNFGVEALSPLPDTDAQVSRTTNFFGGGVVVDHGVEVLEPEPASNVVRVIEDVGPIFLGRRRTVELKKGVLYKVDPDIYKYLSDRQLILGE